MQIEELKNKLVAVLGFGMEGRAVTDYLLKHGIKPVLFDQRPWTEWDQKEQEKIKALGVNFIFGPDCLKELAGFEVAFRSPGISPSNPDLRSRIKDEGSGMVITSQTKWFFEHCPAKIIGVTGTKGKGTTATLIYEILKLQFQISNFKYQTYLTGNIGKIQPLEILDTLKPEDWVVYELSSFQLQDLDRSPHVGVVLMTTSEHLDYHGSAEEYVAAKEAIVKFQNSEDFAVINADFPASTAIGKTGKGSKRYFSTNKQTDCYVENGYIYAKIKGLTAAEPLMETKDLQLRGAHNWQNVCAAILAADLAGCGADSIRKTVKEFKGLEHRLELVAEKQGIKFYNDSFSTTPETAIAAIVSFNEPEILILGGSSKKSDFSVLAETILKTKNIKAVVLIGEEAGHIKKLIAGGFNGQLLEGAKNMEEVFGQIKQVAKQGDVVLLSPACASFDWFKNYQDRGEQFKFFVEKF